MDFQAARQGQRLVESQVRADLRQSSYGEVRRVTCTLKEGVLTLSGQVPSYYLKQIAQRIALARVDETVTVVNELEVGP
ncbi:MAG TPA: BON domain-containing protein [Planctomycetaceae bacterium]|jgi:hypothetical protein|nr:BON domain-containing protein [Planctomycetaceae bacterium]